MANVSKHRKALAKALKRNKKSQVEVKLNRLKSLAAGDKFVALAGVYLAIPEVKHRYAPGRDADVDRSKAAESITARGYVAGHRGHYVHLPYDNSPAACERRLAAELARKPKTTTEIPVVEAKPRRRVSNPKTGF